MPTLTPNFSFQKPLVNNATDADLWGGQLNTNWDDIDTLLKATNDSVLALQDSTVPTGAIFTFPATVPSTFLECDGSEVSRATYADLYAYIGDTYGAGDGSTTFNLPDLRGEFVRGWDNGRGVDSGRALGSAQADEVGDHTHPQNGSSNFQAGGSGAAFAARATTSGTLQPNGVFGNGGDETRPRNIAMIYGIKF